MTDTTENSNLFFLEGSGNISKHGWKARFDHQPEMQCKPFNMPRISQIKNFIPMSLRYTFNFYLRKRLLEKRQPFIDPSYHVPWRPIYGVPMGGIGCGAMGRGFRGEFVRSSLIPGMYSYKHQPADQFILTIRAPNQPAYQIVLSHSKKPPVSGTNLSSWSWGFPEKNAHYVGLYPRSWTVYEIPQFDLVLVCQQISPVIPHNYKSSSLPVCVFVWKAFNFGSSFLNLSLSFSWYGPDPDPRAVSFPQTMTSNASTNGYHQDVSTAGGEYVDDELSEDGETAGKFQCQTSSFKSPEHNISGCLLERLVGNELACCFGIAAKSSENTRVNCCPGFIFDEFPKLSDFLNHFVSTCPPMPGGMCGQSALPKPSSSADVWKELESVEGLSETNLNGYRIINKSSKRPKPLRLAVMVSSTCEVPAASPGPSSTPGQSQMEFACVWHSPLVRFRSHGVTYKRRYSRWFPQPGMEGAKHLLEHALSEWPKWLRKIERWQDPVLSNRNLPDWYKSALFNELYFLTDGGTVWLDPVCLEDGNAAQEHVTDLLPLDLVRADKSLSYLDPYKLTGRYLLDHRTEDASASDENIVWSSWEHRCQVGREMGLFAYLEGHEYRMFNTIDVHCYSSWALIKLWPKLQLAMNYDCADLAIEEDRTVTYFIHHGQYGIRSVNCSVPHDFGDPENEPWRHTNAYVMYPTDNWKDLNPKFILMTWRDWKLTKDDQYLMYMLPLISRIIGTCLKSWDRDGDGVIENSGFPDQTFDTWKTAGISAYTGGIWIACLYATHQMLDYALSPECPMSQYLLGSKDGHGAPWPDTLKELDVVLTKAKSAYEESLWTGTYYAYQKVALGNHESIMAAQLCGQWFIRATGAPEDALLSRSHVLSALNCIKVNNWRSVENGVAGAINGVLPDKRPDHSNVQAEEFWVGINYCLASLMIMEDMSEDGLELAGACYNTIYNRFGLQFQTPEAYMSDGRFRCPGYMRPLVIWSIQQALELKGLHTSVAMANGDDESEDESSMPNGL